MFIPVIFLAGWGIRHHLRGKGQFDRVRRITLGLSLVAWLITESARSWYRPWIYSTGRNDWHIADTVGNSFGTVTAVFVIVSMVGRGTWEDRWLIAGVSLGLICYELIAGPLGGAVDLWDLGATALFGLMCLFIYRRILRLEVDNHETA